MLFSTRIAFSGTPSSLLPLEMGECVYAQVRLPTPPPRASTMPMHVPSAKLQGVSAHASAHAQLYIRPTRHTLQGDDAKMLSTLTNPSIVSTYTLPAGWKVAAALEEVANLQPPVHALIDAVRPQRRRCL